MTMKDFLTDNAQPTFKTTGFYVYKQRGQGIFNS